MYEKVNVRGSGVDEDVEMRVWCVREIKVIYAPLMSYSIFCLLFRSAERSTRYEVWLRSLIDMQNHGVLVQGVRPARELGMHIHSLCCRPTTIIFDALERNCSISSGSRHVSYVAIKYEHIWYIIESIYDHS